MEKVYYKHIATKGCYSTSTSNRSIYLYFTFKM